MYSTYRFNANEINENFLNSIKSLFANKEIEITISEVDETEYLLSSENNKNHILEAMKNTEDPNNLIEVDLNKL